MEMLADTTAFRPDTAQSLPHGVTYKRALQALLSDIVQMLAYAKARRAAAVDEVQRADLTGACTALSACATATASRLASVCEPTSHSN